MPSHFQPSPDSIRADITQDCSMCNVQKKHHSIRQWKNDSPNISLTLDFAKTERTDRPSSRFRRTIKLCVVFSCVLCVVKWRLGNSNLVFTCVIYPVSWLPAFYLPILPPILRFSWISVDSRRFDFRSCVFVVCVVPRICFFSRLVLGATQSIWCTENRLLKHSSSSDFNHSTQIRRQHSKSASKWFKSSHMKMFAFFVVKFLAWFHRKWCFPLFSRIPQPFYFQRTIKWIEIASHKMRCVQSIWLMTASYKVRRPKHRGIPCFDFRSFFVFLLFGFSFGCDVELNNAKAREIANVYCV